MSPAPNETALVVAAPLRAMAQRLGLDEEAVSETLCNTMCKGATHAEIVAFCIVANEHRLNPFKKEIYAFPKKGGGIVPMVPIDGWTNIVNSNPEFDGCDFDEHEDDQGKVYAITCTMHVKNRSHPIVVKERLSECFRGTEPWKQMPCRMLRHKAFMQAARIAFSLGGLFDKDEAEDIGRNDRTLEPPRRVLSAEAVSQNKELADLEAAGCIGDDDIPPETTDETHPEGDLISESQRRRMFAIAHGAGIKDEDLKNRLHAKYGITSSKNITMDVYEEICEWAAKPPAPTTNLH